MVKNLPANAGDQVWFLVWEDPTCRGATKRVGHNYWACALEPGSCNYWVCAPRACAPQREKPLQLGAHTPQLESSPHLPQLEKSLHVNGDPAWPKINKWEWNYIFFKETRTISNKKSCGIREKRKKTLSAKLEIEGINKDQRRKKIEMETREWTEKINESKSWLFEMINKTDKLVPRLTKEKEFKHIKSETK